jgi:4-hydroxy-4-methyl-2-oxoglutarate aldolase
MSRALIVKNPPLIEAALIQQAAKFSSSIIADAMGRIGAMANTIKPVWRNARLLGTALTVELPWGDNLFLHKANCLVGPGYVLVASTGDCTTHAAWGDLMTRAAGKAGAGGLVIDGAVRDVADIEAMQFPVFAQGITPQSTSREKAGRINVPVRCGGIEVAPGDLIIGDSDGVVVVPRAKIQEILERAAAKSIWEEKRIKEIAAGQLEPDWMPEIMMKLGIKEG